MRLSRHGHFDMAACGSFLAWAMEDLELAQIDIETVLEGPLASAGR